MIGPNTGALDTPTMKSPGTEEPECRRLRGRCCAPRRAPGTRAARDWPESRYRRWRDRCAFHAHRVGAEHEAARPGPPLDTRYALSRHPVTVAGRCRAMRRNARRGVAGQPWIDAIIEFQGGASGINLRSGW